MLQGLGKRKVAFISTSLLVAGWGLGTLISDVNLSLIFEELIQQAYARLTPSGWV